MVPTALSQRVYRSCGATACRAAVPRPTMGAVLRWCGDEVGECKRPTRGSELMVTGGAVAGRDEGEERVDRRPVWEDCGHPAGGVRRPEPFGRAEKSRSWARYQPSPNSPKLKSRMGLSIAAISQSMMPVRVSPSTMSCSPCTSPWVSAGDSDCTAAMASIQPVRPGSSRRAASSVASLADRRAGRARGFPRRRERCAEDRRQVFC